MKFDDAIKCASTNQLRYHQIKNNLKVFWDENFKIKKIEHI